MFRLAPVVALLPYLVVLLVIPLGPNGLVAQPLDIGLFFVLAVVGIGVVAVLMAAWSSANKYALLGGLRAAAQLLGYELPLVLAAASVAMAAGTLSLSGIVEAWRPWWLLWQLPAMLIFFMAGLAEIRRPPFDMPIADSELVFGYLTEYTGTAVRVLPARRVRRHRGHRGADHGAVPRRLEGAVRATPSWAGCGRWSRCSRSRS